MATNRATLLVMAGEGIGPEVVAEERRVAEWFIAERGLAAEIKTELYGIDAYRSHGRLLREEALPLMASADAILFGAAGGLAYTELPPEVRKGGSLLRIRKSLDLYANLRPVRGLAALAEASTLKPKVRDGVDLVLGPLADRPAAE